MHEIFHIKINKIRSIPKYILKKIEKLDNRCNHTTTGRVHYYKYFTKFYNRLALVTVAYKTYRKKFYYKQVTIHFVHSKYCFLKDIALCYGGNYSVGWFEQGIQKHPKWFKSTEWDYCLNKYYNLYADIVNINYVLSLP